MSASIQDVRAAILASLEWFEGDGQLSRFAWPDDQTCAQAWNYYVHCAWVQAWNQTNRARPSVDFLRDWISVDENIAAALKQLEDWNALTAGEARS